MIVLFEQMQSIWYKDFSPRATLTRFETTV